MKKILIVLFFLTTILISAIAQELPVQSVQNILWTGLGLPAGDPDASTRSSFRWTGFIDTVQARVDIWKFTIDGMLSWGALTNWWDGSVFDSFDIENTELTQFDFLSENRCRNSYYLNFLMHPFEGFDVGAGTQLDWSVGSSPYTDGLEWMSTAHVEQSDLKQGAPSLNSVMGYMHYANTYAWKALAVRYSYKEIFQVGLAIPDFNDYDGDFTLNIGAEVHPIPLLTIAAAFENLIQEGGNLYTGLTLDFSKFIDTLIADIWFGINGFRLDEDSSEKMWGFGTAVFFKFSMIPLWIRPELGFSKYINSDYTNAFYFGGRANYDITDILHLGGYTSLAWGAKNETWSNNFNGGFIWNIRPDFTFDINERHSLSATFEYELINKPNNSNENKLLFGFFWKYNQKF